MPEGHHLIIPVGPLVVDNDINHQRYLVRFNCQPGISAAQVVQCLIAYGYVICEIKVGNVDRADGRTMGVVKDGFEAYLEF